MTESSFQQAVARGVKTDGIGKPTTAHLNLTVSLADRSWPGRDHPNHGTDIFPRPPYDPRQRERIARIKFAGAEK